MLKLSVLNEKLVQEFNESIYCIKSSGNYK